MPIYIPVDLTPYYQPQTLNIEDEINARSVARFGLVDDSGVLDVPDGSPIEIYDYSGNLIFGGFVNYPRKINPIGTDALFFDIEAIDQQTIADRYLVAEAFISQTAGYIVQTLITNYLSADGVTVGNIEAGALLDVAKFPRANTVAEVMDNLAEICGFVWYIDFDKKLYFQSRSATTAGFNIADNSAILNVNVRSDRSKYRNRQYIRGGQTPTDSPIANESPTPKPDGTTRTFVTRYPIAQEPTITINGTPVASNQIGINGIDGQVTPLQWYWTYGSDTITQDLNQTVLSTTDTITISYIGLIPLLVVVEDSAAIESRALIENLSGVYESLETLPNVNDKQQALDIASGKLRKYTVVPRELTYQTFTNGLAAGQLQTVNLTKYGITAGEFLIDRVTIRDLDDNGTFVYEVHAVDGEPFGGWTKFFESIVRKETGLIIDSDEKLIVLKSVIETDSWTESQAYTVFACPVVSNTLYPSDTLYPC
jgi:hypothetical protein